MRKRERERERERKKKPPKCDFFSCLVLLIYIPVHQRFKKKKVTSLIN